MVQPIDYTMNVLNPIEGYMQGLKFGEDMLAFKQNRELAQSQEAAHKRHLRWKSKIERVP
jgi:hypothetical protein